MHIVRLYENNVEGMLCMLAFCFTFSIVLNIVGNSLYCLKFSKYPAVLRSLDVEVLLSYLIRDQDIIPPRLSTSSAFCIGLFVFALAGIQHP